jgi:hypothetical protein
MTYRTLGELRGELLARVGMGAQGSAGTSQVLLNSFLRNGQKQLYEAQDWKHLTEYADKTLGVGQNELDYPDACARDRRVLRVESVYGGQWRRLPEGIRTEDWSNMETRGYPIRVDRLAQLLVYPRADQVYTIRFWYVRDLARFTQDGDRADMDDEAILLHALANAKAHYRHPDAQQYQGQLSDLLASLRGKNFNGSTVRRDTGAEPERRPLVVGRDV